MPAARQLVGEVDASGSEDEVARLRAILDGGPWTDGNVTSGHQSARAKNNAQLPEESAQAREVGALIEAAKKKG